jgi:hypothetical protein
MTRSLALAALLATGLFSAPPAHAWEGAGLIWPPSDAASPTVLLAADLAPVAPERAAIVDGGGTLAGPAVASVAPAAIEDGQFRLAVPFRTQKDGGRWERSNCGPAVLGMVLDGFGIVGQATDDLRFRAHTYQGTVGMRTGTALEHIARVAEDFGVAAHGLYAPDGRFHTWTLDEIRAQLRQGRPVMPLVRLYLIPGYEGIGTRWGHYILLTGIAADGFTYSDPLQTDPVGGATRTIGADQLARAIGNSHIPGQAVAFSGPPGAALAVVR